MKISEIAVSHRTSVYVLIALLVAGGLGTYSLLPRESIPEVEIPVIVVQTLYPGVSPEDIESLVTRPLEKELKEISDLDYVTSTSAESASIIVIRFTSDVNLDEAKQEVRDKVDLARSRLPKDAEEPTIKAINTTDFPVMIVNVTGAYSVIRLRRTAEELQEKLELVPGVLDVELAGGVEREIQVRVDPGRLQHLGISLRKVVKAVRGASVNMPGGNVDVGDASFVVRVPGEYTSVDEIRSIVVEVRGGVPIHLGDLAEVRDAFKDLTSISRLGGRHNVSLSITKRPGANLLALAETIKAELTAAEAWLPEGTELVILGDQSDDIRDIVKELENGIMTGLILVILVVMVAMGFRNSVLVGIAIPLSMLISFVVLAALDVTLNMVVLFSLILALGMLVDNAIVIVENIYRHANDGKDATRAALDGTREVAWPVFTSTLTTVAVFFPLLFWPGMYGEFMGFLPQTLIITLSASLFVALVITPVTAATFLKARPPTRAHPRVERLLRAYERTLRAAITRRWLTLGIGAVVGGLTFAIFSAADLGVEFFPSVSPRKAFLVIDAGDGTRLEVTDKIAARIEEKLSGLPDIEHFVADICSAGSGRIAKGGNSPHLARISIDFVDRDQRVQPVQATVDQMRAWLDEIPGARFEIQKERFGPPTGAPISIELSGDDFHRLGELTQRVRDRISSIEGIVDLKDDFQTGRTELRIEVDRERAKLAGADIGMIASTVRTAINGTKASVLRDGEDEYDITVRLAADYRDRLDDVEALMINVGKKGSDPLPKLIPIREVARILTGGGKGAIRHKDYERVVTIKGNVEGRLAASALEDVTANLAGLELPAGYALALTGENKELEKSQAFLLKAFIIGLFLIALILVTQFDSVFLPTIIMLAVLLSLIGVFWGQLLLQLPFGIIMTGLGMISLAGVVVNNAIVLVDYIRVVRRRRISRTEALVEAGLVRLRPVLLTAITTVLGLLPMAFGISFDFFDFSLQVGGRSSEFWRPMSVAVISGLVVATVLTLLVVPVLYSIFDDFEVWLRRLAGAAPPADDAGNQPVEP